MLDRPSVTGAAAGAGARSLQAKVSVPAKIVSDYLSLTKPPIILLLLITAVGGMFLAAGGWPPLVLVVLVCAGGALGAGGANALNHYLDQDIDLLMSRTRERPLPGHRVPPVNALVYGILLNVAAFVILTVWVNLLAASLTLAATLFYVFIYTVWLKRRTPQNIVIGGAAGSFPPMVGWAAITGGVDLAAVHLFRNHFFLDAAPFLGLSLTDPEGLRTGRSSDAAGGCYPGAHGPADFHLLIGLGGPQLGPYAHVHRRLGLLGIGIGPGRHLYSLCLGVAAQRGGPRRQALVPLLTALHDVAVRRCCGGQFGVGLGRGPKTRWPTILQDAQEWQNSSVDRLIWL